VLTDTALTTAQLAALDELTTGDISAPSLATLTGPLAEISDLVHIIGDDTVIQLTDTSLTAADLLALRDSTSNAINADSVTSLTGSMEDILAVHDAEGISLDNLTISLSGETAAADLLTFAEGVTGAIDASGVTALTGSLQDINDVLQAGDDEIIGL